MPKTLLIAANDPHIAYLLQRYARQSGFEAKQTGSVGALLELAQATHPALIILELDSLPGSDEAITRLKSDVHTRRIPVVVYTSSGQETRYRARQIAGHLRESVLYDDFVAVLHDIGVQP